MYRKLSMIDFVLNFSIIFFFQYKKKKLKISLENTHVMFKYDKCNLPYFPIFCICTLNNLPFYDWLICKMIRLCGRKCEQNCGVQLLDKGWMLFISTFATPIMHIHLILYMPWLFDFLYFWFDIQSNTNGRR